MAGGARERGLDPGDEAGGGSEGEVGVFAHLPVAIRALLPEVREVRAQGLDREGAADCGDCVKVAARYEGGDEHPWAFDSRVRCCTYHPTLANFLVGRVLRRGGVGAARMRERLRDRSGVSEAGVAPSDRYREQRREAELRYFGRDVRLRCPFWVEGVYSCGIWRDREGVCRTWFCKHERGSAALSHFTAVRAALAHVESRLAEYCVDRVAAPGASASDEAWEGFFVGCAERVEELGAALAREMAEVLGGEDVGVAGELGGVADGSRGRAWGELDRFLPDETLVHLRRRVRDRAEAAGPGAVAVPDVVVPVVSHAWVRGARLAIEGYSQYDGVEVPVGIVEWFVELDGRRSWREALARVRARGAGRGIDEGVVRELVRVDVLREPGRVRREHGVDQVEGVWRLPIPGRPTPTLQRPLALGDRVWLQGAVPLGSMLVGSGIFELLARLDGRTDWHVALEEANRVLQGRGEGVLGPDVVGGLHGIGGLHGG